jgi:hypothetical protein
MIDNLKENKHLLEKAWNDLIWVNYKEIYAKKIWWKC